MKVREAVEIMKKAAGYYVHFETREGGMLASDFFPDRGEPPIVEIGAAWELAAKWAAVDPSRFVNVYVISAFDFAPVDGYMARMLNKYPTEPTCECSQ